MTGRSKVKEVSKCKMKSNNVKEHCDGRRPREIEPGSLDKRQTMLIITG